MMTNRTGALTANYAAYNWMRSAEASTNSMRMPHFCGSRKSSLSLQTSMLNNGVAYKAGLLMEESNHNLTKKNIKRTFDIFG